MSVLASFDVDQSLLACHRQTAAGCIKITEDLDRYARIIAATKPEVIVECGTFDGHSAAWFHQQGPEVVTIDIAPNTGLPYTRDHGPADDVADVTEITWITCKSSTDPATVDVVRDLVGARRTMVVLDSDHSAAHVAAEIDAYGPLVTPGCYLVVEDGILRWLPSSYVGNPLDAIEARLLADPRWIRDEETEAMFPVTMHPAGWWVRA